jgi:hypothetical protein
MATAPKENRSTYQIFNTAVKSLKIRFSIGKISRPLSLSREKTVATIEKISRSTKLLEIFCYIMTNLLSFRELQPRIGLDDVDHLDFLTLPFLGLRIES